MAGNRDEILKDLRSYVIEVHFDKVNGEHRVMRCTLNQGLFSKKVREELNNSEGSRGMIPGVLPVYDLDKKAFRSFRLNSIISVKAA